MDIRKTPDDLSQGSSMKQINSEFGIIPWVPDGVKIRQKPPQKDYHKEGYWKDWYWNKGGRDKVQAKRRK